MQKISNFRALLITGSEADEATDIKMVLLKTNRKVRRAPPGIGDWDQNTEHCSATPRKPESSTEERKQEELHETEEEGKRKNETGRKIPNCDGNSLRTEFCCPLSFSEILLQVRLRYALGHNDCLKQYLNIFKSLNNLIRCKFFENLKQDDVIQDFES